MAVALLVMIAATNGESNLWPEEDDKEVLVRTVRGTKDRGTNSLDHYYYCSIIVQFHSSSTQVHQLMKPKLNRLRAHFHSYHNC